MKQEEKIKNCLKELVDTDTNLYSYVTPKGLKELRVSVANYLKNRLNMKINENNMTITSGSQQSIYLLSRILLKQDDTIISEEPTYFGAIAVFKEVGVNVLTVKIDNDGINLDELKEKISINKPKFIYVVPTFHNPTGICWNNKVREEFLNIINKYDITVIEDDPYFELNYTDSEIKTLYELNNGKNIIYLSSFSKLICSSLNVAYILANEETTKRLYQYKMLNDMNTSLFIQKFVNLYLNKYNVEEDIRIKKEIYEENIKLIKEQLKDEFDNISFSNIQGGLYMTISLPNIKIKPSLYEKNYFNEEYQNYIRINISNTNIDEIIEIMQTYN